MLPVSFVPVVWLLVAGGALTLGYLVVDRIGDRREEKVRAEYAEAARRKNVEIESLNQAYDEVSRLLDTTLAKREAEAAVIGGPACPATKEQARALSAIRRLK